MLRAKNATINGSVYLNNSLYADGELNFRRAEIGSQFSLRDATLIQKTPIYGDRPFFAVNLEFANIGQDLTILELKELDGDIGLQQASAKILADLPEEWLGRKTNYNGRLWLSGFVYDGITGTSIRVSKVDNKKLNSSKRIRWLKEVLPKHYLKGRFVRQPWDQVATVLERSGDYASANKINVEAEKRSFKVLLRNTLSTRWRATAYPLAILYYLFLNLIRFGYGFGYARIFPTLLLLLSINLLIFGISANAGRMKPLEEEIVIEMDKNDLAEPPEYYVILNTCVYAADVLLPISLGQDSKWTPMHMSEKELTIPPHRKDICAKALTSFIPESWLGDTLLPDAISKYARVWLWVNKLLGWACFFLIGATFAGKFRRR